MSDRVARMVAAGETIEVDGVEYRLRPIPIRHLKELEIKALRDYKRSYLQTFGDNADLLDGDAKQTLQQEIRRVATWTLRDLPKIEAYDCTRVPVNDKAKKWVRANYPDTDGENTDGRFRSLLNNALDTGRLSARELEKMTGCAPRKGTVRYDQWWVTASMSGMILFILSSIQVEHPKVTEADIDRWSISKLVEASNVVERLTSSDMGNG